MRVCAVTSHCYCVYVHYVFCALAVPSASQKLIFVSEYFEFWLLSDQQNMSR